MTDEAARFRRIDALFREALRLPPEARVAYLDEHCESALRAEVDALLAEDAAASGALDAPALGERLRLTNLLKDAEDGGSIPDQIGSYRVSGLIGRGGMGVVYEAEQDNPRRRVALKLMPAGAAATSLRRFALETNVLGRLRHPGIAQIYEAGVADVDGRPTPFFAMEFVQGSSITSFADERMLGPRERLRLAASICDAVHHAHQRGVIHRDLKPANILVDEDGQPKVLDFGVARTVDSDMATLTSRTDVGQILGTVPYMSPEQAGGDPEEIDTRSDVYALGVVTYELLAGELPYRLHGRTMADALLTIREAKPKPLRTAHAALAGDVETMIGKALEKEPGRRYDSASAFAEDIRRYLGDEPITARPPSVMYQARKFAKRNRALVGALSLAAVVLAAGVVVSTTFAIRESHAARVSESEREKAQHAARVSESEREKAQRSARISEAEREKSQAVLDFFERVIGLANPDEAGGRDLTLREALELGSAALDESSDSPWEVRAHLNSAVGETLTNMGMHERAIPHLERALSLRESNLEDSLDPAVTTSAYRLARAMASQGRQAEAAAMLEPMIAGLRERVGKGASDRRLDLAEMLRVLGIALRRTDPDRGRLLLTEALELFSAEEETDGARADCLNALAGIELQTGRYEAAEAGYREALALYDRDRGRMSRRTATILSNLGLSLVRQERLAEAETAYVEALEIQRAMSGDSPSPGVCSTTLNLGSLLARLGRLDDAEAMLRESVAAHHSLYAGGHQYEAFALDRLAGVLLDRRAFDEAEELLERARRILTDQLGPRHPYVAVNLNSYAVLLGRRGDRAEAIDVYEAATEIYIEAYGPDHPWVLSSQVGMAECMVAADRMEEAFAIADEAIRRLEQGTPKDDSMLADSYHIRARVLMSGEDWEAASADLSAGLERLESIGLYKHWSSAQMLTDRGTCREKSGDIDGAERDLLSAWSVLLDSVGAEDDRSRASASALADFYERRERLDEAAKWRERG